MMISECCTKEKPLLRRAQSGDSDAIELFLAGYVPLLRALAKRFFCVSLSVQDLCQAGYIGLMLALEHYNAEQGAEFITYAMPWALGEMKKALRQADDFTGAQRFGRQVSRKLRRLSASLGREPRIEELAQACHTSPSDVVCALEAGYTPMSLDEPAQNTGRTLLDALAGGDSIDDQKLDIRLALMHLPIQQRNLIILRYVREHYATGELDQDYCLSVIISYLGLMKHCDNDALRRKVLEDFVLVRKGKP